MEWARFALLAAFSLGTCLPLAPRGGEDEEASSEEALTPKFELPEAKFTAVPGWARPKVERGKSEELLKRTVMRMSGKIEDGLLRKGSETDFEDYLGHYCPAIYPPPIFELGGGALCRECLTIVNELLEYLYVEDGGSPVPLPMVHDTEQMQTAFTKVCTLVASADVRYVNDCKNFIEYWGAEIWCHIASGSFIDEGREDVRCPPGEDDRRCTRHKPPGMERTAEIICQHLKFMEGSGAGALSEDWCDATFDKEWFKWKDEGHVGVCCPSMIVGHKPNNAKVAEFGRHYYNPDMIDLRYGWVEHEQAEQAKEGVPLQVPAPRGRLFAGQRYAVSRKDLPPSRMDPPDSEINLGLDQPAPTTNAAVKEALPAMERMRVPR